MKLMSFFLLAMTIATAQSQSTPPKGGFVPDEKTAIAVGVAVLIPIYRSSQIKREQPFVATLKEDVWTVHGTLPRGHGDEVIAGGVATVTLQESDGKILEVWHGK
ncbi:MAG: YbbC/YhhH family protein [Acidobacteriia bacterium]|nr:YbbC/YhhH family protein [Terriglobia bacterium]